MSQGLQTYFDLYIIQSVLKPSTAFGVAKFNKVRMGCSMALAMLDNLVSIFLLRLHTAADEVQLP